MKNYPSQKIPKLFSNCILVKGYVSSLICDLQREIYFPIPNDLYEVFAEFEDLPLDKIYEHYGTENSETIKEYLEFLTKYDLIHFVEADELESFPNMSMHWESPSLITNAVLQIESNNIELVKKTIYELETLGCKNLELQITINIESELENILQELKYCFKDSRYACINITINYLRKVQEKYFEILKIFDNRIGTIIIHSSPKTEFYTQGSMGNIYFIEQNISYTHSCGLISPNYLFANVPLFTEAQHHNTCLNRKISIDANGEIKNCPSMAKSYGNIKDTTLAEAIEKPGFKDLWDINKDKIHVCKDCEFRYICTDCRAYIENPEDIYSKPLKCGYNPYTAEWEEWSTNPLKQKAIEYYGMQELVKKEPK
jgi:SPASM domain peptide maturase of grasp-with-spasm system